MKQKLRVGIFGFGRTGKIVVGEFLQAPDIDVQWVIKQTPLVETQYRTYASSLTTVDVL